VLVEDFKAIKLGLVLNDLNSLIEGQNLHMPPFGKSTKKIRMLQMHKENYESNPKICKQKLIPMHPILEVSP
jgi:hypothetical protein